MPITFSFGDGVTREPMQQVRFLPRMSRAHAYETATRQRAYDPEKSTLSTPWGSMADFLRLFSGKIRYMEQELEKARSALHQASFLPIESSRAKVEAKLRPALIPLRQINRTASKAEHYLTLFLAQR